MEKGKMVPQQSRAQEFKNPQTDNRERMNNVLEDGSMDEGKEFDSSGCPVFGVRSGGPVIGLGILLILFGLIPMGIDNISFPLPIALIFIGFGLFLIWAGLTK